ncbi:hypothetical protein [Streptomyces sp. NPDC057877]|uniref:hypothetical protein n=1 Tax=Streptomyces sp. NPDC057877 TaxID=3346269 RepID=UPI0036909213
MVLVVLGVLMMAVVVVGVVVGRREAPAGWSGESWVVRRVHGRRQGGLLGGVAAFAVLGSVLVYLWGALHVGGAVLDAEDGGTDSSPIRPCRREDTLEQSVQGIDIIDYDVSWLPLGFECETSDGGRYDSGEVPSYVNPAVFGLAIVGVGCGVAARYRREALGKAGGQEGGRLPS